MTQTVSATYRTLWRWHFYAGLFCIPFIVLLAVSGSVYLFKPQIEHWQDRVFDTQPFRGKRLGPQAEASVALAAVPGSVFDAYELPHGSAAAGRVWLRDAAGERLRVVVHPVTGEVLDMTLERHQLMNVIKTLHGELLLGDGGSLFVELAGDWAIVLVLTGLYLCWPRGATSLAGALYPRVTRGSRILWRDLHAVTGFWVALSALLLLITALPWTGVWGNAFKQARQLAATAPVTQAWSVGRSADVPGAHQGHTAQAAQVSGPESLARLPGMVQLANALGWSNPVLVSPAGQERWCIKAEPQNRPMRRAMTLDAHGGAVLSQETFADKPAIDRVVGIGVAAHEGQLFGPLNQLLGVATALGLVIVAASGAVTWWRRRPHGQLGAPPTPAAHFGTGLIVLIVAGALLLPVLGASLVLIGLLEWTLLRHHAALRRWLGLNAPADR